MNENKDLQELLEKSLEGTASSEEQQQVIEAAEESEEFRQIVLESAEMDAYLDNTGRDEELFSTEVVKRIMNKGKSGPFARVIREKIEKGKVKPLARASERLRAMRGHRRSPLKRFAAAAVILLGIGAVFAYLAFMQTPEDILTLSHIAGTVIIERDGQKISAAQGINVLSGDTVITGGNSLCRVDSKDGSIIALNENTGITFSLNRHGLNSLTYQKGQVFADVSEQKRDLSVNMGGPTLTVLGTRFQIRKSYDKKYTTIDVFKGNVKVQEKMFGGYIYEGHSGYFVGYDSGNPDTTRDIRTGLYVIIPVETIPIEWLKKVNCTIQDILSAYTVNKKSSLIDFDNYWIRDGIWKVEQKGNDTVISQELPHCDMAAILFGKAKWERGTISVDFKINEYAPGNEEKRISISFFYEKDELSYRSYESFGLSDQLEPLRKQGYTGWVNLKIDFKVIAAEDALEMQMFVDPLPKGAGKGSFWKIRKDSTNSTYILERKKVGVGLLCSGVSAEFRNFKIIPR